MNYTIYISALNDKAGRFFDEENKSGLVNKLLDEHYAGNGPLIPRLGGVNSAPAVPRSDEPKKVPTSPIKANVPDNYCPHGYGKGMCKFADCNKKYHK